MAWLMVTLQVTNNQQFGTLLLRSSVDLMICLIYNVEKALVSGHKALLLIMNIKEVFDVILPGRLAHRLCE